MTTETILTELEVSEIYSRYGSYNALRFARAIEQAVLQSPEIQALRDVLERCRLALEPYDDVKPRDWKTDRENLRYAHQVVCATLSAMEQQK